MGTDHPPRDFLAGAAGLARTSWIRCEAVVGEPHNHHAAGTGWGAWALPLPATQPSRWTPRRAEEEGGT